MDKITNPDKVSVNPLSDPQRHPKGANLMQALNDGVTNKRLTILRGVAQTGSISESARQSKVSYKSAWQAIETLSRLAGAVLVEKTVGGTGGGGARLTKAGEKLLQSADQWQQWQRRWFADQHVPPFGLRMQTSMRNQWPVSVIACQPMEGCVRVALCMGDEQRLWAQITPESQRRLAIEPGAEVLAMCKANAVSAQRLKTDMVREERMGESVNRFEGRLIERDSQAIVKTGDAVTATLAPDLTLVGYWRDTTLNPSEVGPVIITIEESAVVIAITREN